MSGLLPDRPIGHALGKLLEGSGFGNAYGLRPGKMNCWSEAVFRSPIWTRTRNLPINSRLLCQLSYRGLSLARPVDTGRAEEKL